MLGGFTGIMHSAAPADAQQQDSYFIVAHFHYVLIGGSILSLLGGLYYWQPKMTGRMANEKIGKLIFWVILIGFNVTFFPMHFLGLNGMPRRIYTYDTGLGWDFWNFVCTIGALTLGVGISFGDSAAPLHRVSGQALRQRSLARPDARMVAAFSAPGIQLRRDPRRPGARRLLARQTYGSPRAGTSGCRA